MHVLAPGRGKPAGICQWRAVNRHPVSPLMFQLILSRDAIVDWQGVDELMRDVFSPPSRLRGSGSSLALDGGDRRMGDRKTPSRDPEARGRAREERQRRRRRAKPRQTSNELSPPSDVSDRPERTAEDLVRKFEAYNKTQESGLDKRAMSLDRRGREQQQKEEELHRKEEELHRKEEELHRKEEQLRQKNEELESERNGIMRDKSKLEKIYKEMDKMKEEELHLRQTLKDLGLDWVWGVDKAGKGPRLTPSSSRRYNT
ncbi:hypothetical protein B0I37DRAFT_358076 [Chaetomium sp. MPI-CAGE-AT-0009]|nr:hypothetical protein B0I37DRAFT_358076 [Chaetomium sp. MPI-CAGE-AT-0009]